MSKVRKSIPTVALVGLLSVGWGSSIYAGLPSYMTVEGKNQGTIEGGVEIQGREGTILVIEWHHLVQTPIEQSSGNPSGSQQHNPFVFTKVVDKASPKLYQAWQNGELLNFAELKFYRINQAGQEEHYFTLRFENALIVAIEPFMPNSMDPANEFSTHMERLRIAYQRLTITYEDGGITAVINWGTGGA